MKIKIDKEKPFRAQKETFSVGPTSAGYSLEFSVDGENWNSTDYEVPADEQLIFYGCTPFILFRLAGNQDDEITVIV